MATSTFFDKVVFDDKATDVILAGMKQPKVPLPSPRLAMDALAEGERALERFRLKLRTQSDNPKN